MRISDWSSDVCSSDLSRSSGGASGALQEQIRQSALERYQQDFAALRAALDDDQREQWDAAVSALVGARRAPLYKLVDGQPQAVMVRIGAGDGTSTEVSGDIEAVDLVVTGERRQPCRRRLTRCR